MRELAATCLYMNFVRCCRITLCPYDKKIAFGPLIRKIVRGKRRDENINFKNHDRFAEMCVNSHQVFPRNLYLVLQLVFLPWPNHRSLCRLLINMSTDTWPMCRWNASFGTSIIKEMKVRVNIYSGEVNKTCIRKMSCSVGWLLDISNFYKRWRTFDSRFVWDKYLFQQKLAATNNKNGARKA